MLLMTGSFARLYSHLFASFYHSCILDVCKKMTHLPLSLNLAQKKLFTPSKAFSSASYLFGESLVSCTSRGQVETTVPRLVIDKQIVLNVFALYFKPKLFVTLATFRRTVSKLSLVSTCGIVCAHKPIGNVNGLAQNQPSLLFAFRTLLFVIFLS